MSAFYLWRWGWWLVVNVLWLQGRCNTILFFLFKHWLVCKEDTYSWVLETLSAKSDPHSHTHFGWNKLVSFKKINDDISIYSAKQDWDQLSFHFSFQKKTILLHTIGIVQCRDVQHSLSSKLLKSFTNHLLTTYWNISVTAFIWNDHQSYKVKTSSS